MGRPPSALFPLRGSIFTDGVAKHILLEDSITKFTKSSVNVFVFTKGGRGEMSHHLEMFARDYNYYYFFFGGGGERRVKQKLFHIFSLTLPRKTFQGKLAGEYKVWQTQ